MSMTTQIWGVIPPNKDYLKMKAVWEACTDACIEIPEDVEDYFEGEEPDKKGMRIKIIEAVGDCSEPRTTGYEIDLSKLPQKVKLIRFVQSLGD